METFTEYCILYIFQCWIVSNTLKNYYNNEYWSPNYCTRHYNCINSTYTLCFVLNLIPLYPLMVFALYDFKYITIKYIKIKK